MILGLYNGFRLNVCNADDFSISAIYTGSSKNYAIRCKLSFFNLINF